MPNSQRQLWSNNPNAPRIPYDLYFREKANFAGFLIGSILYGAVIVLFFRCMAVLFNPVYRRRKCMKWGLAFHTLSMFSVVTVGTAMQLNIQSISYIDSRQFTGVGGLLPSGPLGCQWLIYSKVLGIVPDLMFFLNNWLADGLMLYRCYVIYSMNLWVIGFPCLMYLGSLAMGIMLIYQTSQPNNSLWGTVAVNFGLPFFSISIALNILLTLMIVIRLVVHSRNIRAAMGVSTGIGGLYKAVVTMLVESCALYAVNSLLFIVPWAAGSHASDTFLPILAQTQVIAPLLIIQRAANKSTLKSSTVVFGYLSESNVGSRGMPVAGGGTLPGGDHMGSLDDCESPLAGSGSGLRL